MIVAHEQNSFHHSPSRHLTLYTEQVDHRGIGLRHVSNPTFAVIQRRKNWTVVHRLALVCTFAGDHADRYHEDYRCHCDTLALQPDMSISRP